MKNCAEIFILNNKKCQVDIDDDGVKLLYNYLSFKAAGVEYTQEYKRGMWDGLTRLFSNKTHKFNFGLLNTVKKFLKNHDYEVVIIDKRKPIQHNDPINVSNRLDELGLTPREHQIRAVNLVPKHQRGIIRAATGSGKTLITLLMTAKINKPTIICVIGLDLLNQFHELYSKVFDEEIGYIGNGVCDIKRINIASIWTIGSALNCKKIVDDDELSKDKKKMKEQHKQKIVDILTKTEVFFIDESHVVTCNTISSIYKKINPTHLFGFSGTPYRDDGSDLLVTGILGEKIIDISASELIDKGLLAQPMIKFFDVPKKFMPGNPTYLESYRDYIVENEVRNKIIVKQTKSLVDKGYTPLVLFKQIKHGNILAELFEEFGIDFEMLSGKDKLELRDEVKKRVSNGETKVLLASTILDIGVDIPKLNALILCGGGKSSIKTLQRIGRVIRKYPGKKIAAVVDFNDDCKYLKGHSKYRFKTYKREKGFKVIKSKRMK